MPPPRFAYLNFTNHLNNTRKSLIIIDTEHFTQARAQARQNILAYTYKMAAREMPNEAVARVLLAMGDDYNYADATANSAEITEVGIIARTIGDWLYSQPTVRFHQQEDRAERSRQASWLGQFKNVVDTILEWLENCGQKPAQKKEQVLRGLYNLTGKRYLYNHFHFDTKIGEAVFLCHSNL